MLSFVGSPGAFCPPSCSGVVSSWCFVRQVGRLVPLGGFYPGACLRCRLGRQAQTYFKNICRTYIDSHIYPSVDTYSYIHTRFYARACVSTCVCISMRTYLCFYFVSCEYTYKNKRKDARNRRRGGVRHLRQCRRPAQGIRGAKSDRDTAMRIHMCKWFHF